MKNLNYILLFLLSFMLSCSTQKGITSSKVVKGYVYDNGGAFWGAEIRVKNTERKVYSDPDGKFEIEVKEGETLVFTYVSLGTAEIKVDARNYYVVAIPPYNPPKQDAYYPKPNKKSVIVTISTRELTTKYTPKRYFKGNGEKGIFLIFIYNQSSLEQKDLEFQKKYNIKYLPFDTNFLKWFKKHNYLTFNFLNKQYPKIWLSEVRKDAVGLENFEQ